MQISLQWINELVNIKNVNLKYLVEKLSLGGFEVEEIINLKINNQVITILDISSTANRADSLSMLGISSEITALLNKPKKKIDYSMTNFVWNERIKNIKEKNPNNKYCSIFLAFTIENLNKIITPLWLKQKLKTAGFEPKNDFLNFQNYLLLETGYPIEFYDRDKILLNLQETDFQLKLRALQKSSEFCANNLESYKLSGRIPILEINNKILSIAGIVSANNFIPTSETKSLLVEFSIFDSKIIRQKSRLIGLRTERSARYEKSLKTTYLIDSIYRLITLLKISNPNLNCTFHTNFQTKSKHLSTINLYYKTVKEILGPIKGYTEDNTNFISRQKISKYLYRLDLPFNFNSISNCWDIRIPILRSEDLTSEIDLIEEIGRLHGFNNFLTRIPNIKKIGVEDSSYKIRKKLISSFLNVGLNELLNYSLVNKKTFFDNRIALFNPLFNDYGNLRASLLPNLIMSISNNLKQINSYSEGFEIGHVFRGNKLSTLSEIEYISGIFGGQKTKVQWSDNLQALGWFEAKGLIEQIFEQLNLLPYWRHKISSEYETIFHPYCKAELYFSNSCKLGIFGQINPDLAHALKITANLYLFEFNFEILKKKFHNNKLPIYKKYSSYPKINKDLSFFIDKNINFDNIKKVLWNNGTKYLTEINLLDTYVGKAIPENHISLCLQLTFQSDIKTLENKTIENIILKLQILLNEKFKIIIRD